MFQVTLSVPEPGDQVIKLKFFGNTVMFQIGKMGKDQQKLRLDGSKIPLGPTYTRATLAKDAYIC